MMSKDRPNLLSSSSFHCTVMAGGAAMTMKIDAPPQQELARDQPGLDGLAETDVVGDQEVDARQAQRLAQRQQLVGIEPDAGAERRLQQVAVGGGRRTPANRPQIGRQHLGTVRRAAADAATRRPPRARGRRFRRPTGPRSARPAHRRQCRTAGPWSGPAGRH